jgi:glycosyltransferase involved in cell wall biosynthesis
MTSPERNAAIYYVDDGYDPVKKGINGRRVAGGSFLRGFLRNADVAEFVMLARNEAEISPVRELAQQLRPDIPLRLSSRAQSQGLANGVGSVFYPSPNFKDEAWRRAPYGGQKWSLCGITHTTSTAAVMSGWMELRTAPVYSWDSVICTSQAVLKSTEFSLDLVDEYLRQHLGAVLPPRPMLPVIPLGIHCADFARDNAARAELRARIGAGEHDVVFATIARLTPHEKFDPLPIYLAMQRAQAQMVANGRSEKLHVVFCGQYQSDYARRVFEQGAAKLMPDVGFHVLDGAKEAERRATLSGADVFVFLIDNIQETFGLAPLEGMAAGLPLLVSDWDGLKDTVSTDIGFRVTTRMLPGPSLGQEAQRYQANIDNYHIYCATTSAVTEIDMPELVARIVQLASDANLRAKMGAAALARVRALFDWRHVVPMMQDLWQEQGRIRAAAALTKPLAPYPLHLVPIAPSPTALFAGYPTATQAPNALRLRVSGSTHNITEMLNLRDYRGIGRIFASHAQVEQAYASVAQSGANGIDLEQMVAASQQTPGKFSRAVGERIAMWLLKYDFVQRA